MKRSISLALGMVITGGALLLIVAMQPAPALDEHDLHLFQYLNPIPKVELVEPERHYCDPNKLKSLCFALHPIA